VSAQAVDESLNIDSGGHKGGSATAPDERSRIKRQKGNTPLLSSTTGHKHQQQQQLSQQHRISISNASQCSNFNISSCTPPVVLATGEGWMSLDHTQQQQQQQQLDGSPTGSVGLLLVHGNSNRRRLVLNAWTHAMRSGTGSTTLYPRRPKYASPGRNGPDLPLSSPPCK